MLEPHVRGAPLTLNCGSINGPLCDREGVSVRRQRENRKRKWRGKRNRDIRKVNDSLSTQLTGENLQKL